MTAIHIVAQRATGTDTQSNQSLLQPFYYIAAALVVLALIILRIIVLRRRNQALSNFFRIGRGSQYSYGSYPPYDSNHVSIHGIQLAPVPAAYRPDRRVRSADIDAHGRRLGPAGAELDGKEGLPAYDNLDRPPKYIEAGWSHGAPTEQSGATLSPAGEESGLTHPIATDGASGNRPLEDTHAALGVTPRSEVPPTIPPPAHHGLSSS